MLSPARKARDAVLFVRELAKSVERLQIALGRIESKLSAQCSDPRPQAHEFRVFSQWGEDGIIDYLMSQLSISRRLFIEFGVENYRESNTRFLLVHQNWTGLIIDGSEDNVAEIKKQDIYWRHNLKAEHAFVTRDNINALILAAGIEGEIGLLSIDIDGNDYWVWDSLNVVSPAVVVIEYNHRFGKERAVTIPYSPTFARSKAHSSHVYYGASLKALTALAKRKGFALVGCNSAGNNAFFVRKDLLNSSVQEVSVNDAFVGGQFREARDSHGHLQFMKPEQEYSLIQELPLVDVQ